MSVRPETLENREQGPAERPSRKGAAELETLRSRIAMLKAIERPRDSQPHCSDCYRRGWRAALAALEGDT